MSDKELAEKLERSEETIVRARKRLGIHKGPRGQVENVIEKVHPKIGKQMDESSKKEFFKTQLVNSLYYDQIKQQLTKEEIAYYLEEWAALCTQFSDVVSTEKRQIDELIKTSIMDNRILRNIRIIEDEIGHIVKEIEQLRKNVDYNDNIELQERDQVLTDMVNMMSAEAKNIARDHNQLVELKNKLLTELNARRKDRVEQIKNKGRTFLDLVEQFTSDDVREKQGEYAELLRLARENQKNKWRKPHRYPDGSVDNILLDEFSVIEENGSGEGNRHNEEDSGDQDDASGGETD